jgi:zinc protease
MSTESLGRVGRTGAVLLALFLAGRFALNAQERFRRFPPPPDPTPELRLPNIESITLSNGLVLSTVFREGQPFINLQLIVQAGEADSPPSLPGVASFTANMIPRGTLLLSAPDIEERIEAMGGRFSVSPRMAYTLFSFQFLEEYLDQALSLLSQMFLQPAFTERELGAVRYLIYYDLLDNERDPAYVAKRHLLRELFRGHPYRNGLYNKEGLKNIKLSDVVDFFQKQYFANRSQIILTGNLSQRTAIRKVSHYFNTWARDPHSPPDRAAPPLNGDFRVVFIDVPQASGAAVFLGNVVPSADSPEFFPLEVFNQVLGGSVNSRLILNLRESKGYAYYVFSQLEPYPGFCVFVIRARVEPAYLYASVREILSELRADVEPRLPTPEVEQAKTFLLGHFPLSLERLEDFSRKVAELKALSLGDDYLARYEENILSVGPGQIHAAVQSLGLLTPVVVIAGDKNLLSDQLKFFDKVDIFDIQGTFQYSLSKEIER